MIFARLVLERDVDEVVELGRIATAESLSQLVFNVERCRETVEACLTGSPTMWVCEGPGRRLIGFLIAEWGPHAFADGIFAEQRIVYVLPDHRRTRAAAALMRSFRAWAKQIGASEIRHGSSASRRA